MGSWKTYFKDSTVPCIDCTSREIGCHGTCVKFAEYKQRKETIAQAKREAADIEYNEYMSKVNRKVGQR